MAKKKKKSSTTAAKNKTARKTSSTKGGAKKKSSKKLSKTTAKKKKKSKTKHTTVPSSMPKGKPVFGMEVNGVAVITPDGRSPGKRGAQGYVEGKRIKKVKVVQGVRSGGIGDISDLTKSMRTDGIIEPLVVRPAGDGKNFELLAGERRHTAAKTIGGKTWESIPVIIRMDAQGDDDRAITIAVSENSPDGRSNLNVIDIGRQAARLAKKKWSPERIAKEFGIGLKTVRRSLQLMDTSLVIQDKVRGGYLSMTAALELNQLPLKRQKELEDKVGPGTTVDVIRRERKKLEVAEAKANALGGKPTEGGTAKGKQKAQVSTAWKSPSDKKAMLRSACSEFHKVDGNERGTTEWHEMRGVIACILWDRGDLESPYLPSVFVEEMSNPADDKKVNAMFNSIVGNEAARFSSKS